MSKQREVKQWITINGNHVPVYEDGSLGGVYAKFDNKGKESKEVSTGKKTFRVYYKDGNQKLLEADSKEDLDAYLEEKGEKVSKTEEAKEYDNKNTLKSTDLPGKQKEIDQDELMEVVDKYNASSPVSGSWDTETEHEQKTIADHFGISMDEAKQVMKDQLGFDEDMFIKESHGGSFEAELEEHSDSEYKNVTKGVKTRSLREQTSLAAIQSYGYDPHDATGDPTVINADGKSYYKIGDDKWNEHSAQGKALGGTYSDKQMAEKLSSAKDIKVMPSEKSDIPVAKKFGMEPSSVEYGRAISAANKNWNITRKQVEGKDMPKLIDDLKEGETVEVSERGSVNPTTYTRTKDGIEYRGSGSFDKETITLERAKQRIKNDVTNNVAIRSPKSIKIGDKEVGVSIKGGPMSKEEAYMNYKAIRISKYMSKEKQEELRKLKNKYYQIWKG